MIRRNREERRERFEREQRQRRMTLIGAAVLVVVLVAGIGYAVFANMRAQQASQPPDGVLTVADLPQGHVEGTVAYAETPPIGGEHAPVWQTCGAYPAPIVPERGVHSLEHGAVWVTYRPDLPADQIDIVRGLADNQTYVLASPFPDLPSPVVATGWGNQLLLDSADDPRLEQFLRAFRQGPQTPELGATCSGGSSEVA